MTLETDTRPCPVCREPRNRHLISGKLVDVETWHRVWTAFGMKPSIAHTPLVGVDKTRTIRPLIQRPLIGDLPEGTEPPRVRLRRVV